MEQEQREEIEQLFEPLKQSLGDKLKTVFLYGSSVRKSRVEGSDIDLVVLLDDTHRKYDESTLYLSRRKIKEIEKTDEFKLHIQPPKTLSEWWSLLLKGEPWAVTACRQAQAIYDPTGFLESMRKTVRNTDPQATDLRARRLLERAEDNLEEGRKTLREGSISSMAEGMTDAAKSALEFRSTPPVSRRNAAQELEKIAGEHQSLEDSHISFYRETLEIENSPEKHELTGSEIDSRMENALEFVEVMAEIFHEEYASHYSEIAEESYSRAREICRNVLAEAGKTTGDDPVERFQEEFVNEGSIDREYGEILSELRKAVEESPPEDLEDDKMYEPVVYLKDFESAVESIEEETGDGQTENDYSQIKPVSEFQDRLLEEHRDSIKAIWLLTKEQLLETQAATAVVLIEESSGKTDIEDSAEWFAGELREEFGFDIHPRIIELSDYWRGLQSYSIETISQVRNGISIYDPEGFIAPVKELVDQGRIEKTVESLSRDIIEAPEQIEQPTKRSKLESLEKFYNTSIELGQAALLKVDVTPPVQKKVADTVQEELVEKRKVLDAEDVKTIERTVSHWKNLEYGNIDQISGGKLDEIASDLQELSENVGKFIG